MKIEIHPIGTIHTPYREAQGVPIQPVYAGQVTGTVELLPEYEEGLLDLSGFSHIMLLYHFHRSKGYRLLCKPFLDTQLHGVFATRAPRRPNPLGLSIVELLDVTGRVLTIGSPDMLDGTPLFDIKPYVSTFDTRHDVRNGWAEQRGSEKNHTADSRFAEHD